MRPRLMLFAVVTVVIVAGCQQKASSDEQSVAQGGSEAARAAILDGNARWVRYTNANQPDSLVTLYTPDGVAMPPDVPGASGKDSILARLRTLVIPGGTLTVTNQNVSASGPVAVARGVWSYTAPAQGSNPAVNLHGKYMEHWHNVNGQWLIAENIWNTDAPAPQPSAPPPASPAKK